MRTFSLALILAPALCLALTGCEDPAANAPKATVGSAAPKTSAAAPAKTAAAATATAAAVAPPAAPATIPAAPSGALSIDPAGSSVGFVGGKITGKHEGKFEKISGWASLGEGDKAEGGKIAVQMDLASVTSDDPKLTGHLKSPDFFDVAQFPSATFVATEVKAGGDKGATHTVTGDLDLHGVKKSVTFPATIKVEAGAVTATAEFSINRKDFKIVYPGMPDDLIKDDVLIKLSLKLPRAAK